MQLRLTTRLTSEEYVRQEGWRTASLERCPLHPEGGCGFARHTAYERVEPAGCKIARFYCRTGHTTFSLLPDCLASRLSGSLEDVEKMVAAVEESAASLERATETLRPEIELAGALRWLRLRKRLVRAALSAVTGLLPNLLAGCEPTLRSIRSVLGTEPVLVELRQIAAAHLAALPPPLGFGPRPEGRWIRPKPLQQGTGTDPPR